MLVLYGPYVERETLERPCVLFIELTTSNSKAKGYTTRESDETTTIYSLQAKNQIMFKQLKY